MNKLYLAGGVAAALAIGYALAPRGGPSAGEPAAGTEWIDAATGMKFVWIPGGCGPMGSDVPLDSRTRTPRDDEVPAHEVCVRGFYMGRYEVTQAQYQAVVGRNPSRFSFRTPDLPVENVSWQDAQDFAARISRSSGARVRLPTEAEWEYACRAGTTHRPAAKDEDGRCGDGRDSEIGHFSSMSQTGTQPVGGKRPNAWGLYDMGGNVWEWVEDCYHQTYAGAPADGSPWTADSLCNHRVKRGGAWSGLESHASLRGFRDSTDRDNNHGDDTGFRLVREP